MTDVEFKAVVVKVVVVGVLTMGTSFVLLWIFWKRLEAESEAGETTSRKSTILVLVVLIVVLLAMSFGRAVIAPRRGCVIDTLDEAGGILYDADDPQGLEGALRVALDADLEAMGRHNGERLDRFDWSRVAEATRDVYGAALKEPDPAD